MTLSRHSSRVYMDEDDLRGTISVLKRRAASEDDSIVWGIYSGAARALGILLDHDYIDTQLDFMTIFETFKKGERYED